MSSFDLRVGETLELDLKGQRVTFRAMPHPGAPNYVHAMSGTEGTVFHLACEGRPEQYALKVMRAAHRTHDLIEICAQLDRLKTLPGMSACERYCLHSGSSPWAVSHHPDLTFSILIPWMQGVTWSEVIQSRQPLPAHSTHAIAHATALVLAGLEQAGVAHCDISGPNVILDPSRGSVHLVDVEHCFAKGFTSPSIRVAGSSGYNLLSDYNGAWAPEADRFATAILLSEMLCWSDPDIVAGCSSAGCFFDPAEIQSPTSARARQMTDSLHRISPSLASLFQRTWQSPNRAKCPAVVEWASCILSLAPPQPGRGTTAQIPRTVPLNAPPPVVMMPEPAPVAAIPTTHQGVASVIAWSPPAQPASKPDVQAPVVLWESLGPVDHEADPGVVVRWDTDLWGTDDKAKS